MYTSYLSSSCTSLCLWWVNCFELAGGRRRDSLAHNFAFCVFLGPRKENLQPWVAIGWSSCDSCLCIFAYLLLQSIIYLGRDGEPAGTAIRWWKMFTWHSIHSSFCVALYDGCPTWVFIESKNFALCFPILPQWRTIVTRSKCYQSNDQGIFGRYGTLQSSLRMN